LETRREIRPMIEEMWVSLPPLTGLS